MPGLYIHAIRVQMYYMPKPDVMWFKWLRSWFHYVDVLIITWLALLKSAMNFIILILAVVTD